MSKIDGGPAFPIKDYKWLYDDEYDSSPGMSLRDYFAAKAMEEAICVMGGVVGYEQTTKQIAKRAYEMADAMLAERSKDA